MKNVDNFIEEIKEDVRLDKTLRFLQTYKNHIIIGIFSAMILFGGAFYWHSILKAKKEKVAQEFFETTFLFNKGKTTEALKRLSILAQDKNYGVFSRFLKASILSQDPANYKKVEEIYESLSSDYKIDKKLRNLAELKLLLLRFDQADFKKFEDLLKTMSNSASPWRTIAKELLATLMERKGNSEQAKKIYEELAKDASATQSIQLRAKALATRF